MQLKLKLQEQNTATESRWEKLDKDQRGEIVEKLARIIAKAMIHDEPKERKRDDRHDKD